MIIRKSILVSLALILFIPMFSYAGDIKLIEDGKIPGKPFEALQQQIDEINSKLNALFGQTCPERQFLTGIDVNGNIICGGIGSVPQETTYSMNCPKSDNDVGLTGTDPFDSSHANYRLEFSPELVGGVITAIAVEISDIGGSIAYVELKDTTTGDYARV